MIEKLLKNLKNDEGITFKNNKPIRYKAGWQVGISGIKRKTIKATVNAVKKYQSCGVWYSNGIYYIDSCKRINTKKQALEIGRKYEQESIYNWKTGKLAWC